jgi:hypothetical protein
MAARIPPTARRVSPSCPRPGSPCWYRFSSFRPEFMILRGAFTLAALLALTACAGAFSPAPTERQTATTPPPTRTPPAIVRAAPTNRTTASAATKPRISDLIGRAAAQIDAQIGAPDLVRSEGEGELRIYRNAACVLHVFAYPRGGVRQATHIEARTPDGQIVGAEADDCLARFAPS